MDVPWHNLTQESVLANLGSGFSGLSDAEAEARLKKHGMNVLARQKRLSGTKIFLRQFASALVLILVAAGAIAWFLGDAIDAIAIFAIVIVNAFLGFAQEFRAEKAIVALKKMTVLQAVVTRSGIKRKIDSAEIVPGDIVELEAGTKVPADIRLIESFGLKADEAVLTGEDMPVEKNTAAVDGKRPLNERINMAFAGTIIVAGRGLGVAVETGMKTEFGKIAGMIREFEKQESPLKRRMDSFAKKLGIFVIILAAATMALLVFRGETLFMSLMVAVALGVAAIPEGLPAVISITLAIGVLGMSRRKAIVRRMPVVEALGSATVICSDKTGTITRNEMVVEKIWANNEIISVTGEGYSLKGGFFLGNKGMNPAEHPELRKLLEIGLLCNNSLLSSRGGLWSVVGDPMEGALVVAAEKGRIKVENHKINELPFSSERMMMTVVNRLEGKTFAHSKGALEKTLSVCRSILEDGKTRALASSDKLKILDIGNRLAGESYRVLGFSFKELGMQGDIAHAEKGMVFVGFVALSDPPREGVRQAVSVCRTAGISVKMVTGDALNTSTAIARQVGIDSEQSLLGSDIDGMDDEELCSAVKQVSVFARAEQKHKIRIVEALKANGEIVAVTGDGVNDAPALKKADIGIAMGIKGTDVTKETSDIVLKDDNFATIVSAVKEGRRIYANIKNFIKYLLAANTSEIGVVTGASLIGAPLPLLPVHILWVNIATDSLPALALGKEPPSPDIMHKSPRGSREGLLSGIKVFIIMATIMAMFAASAAYLYGLQFDIDAGIDIADPATPSKARTMVFTEIVIFELALVFSCRGRGGPLGANPLSNRALVAAVAVSVVLQLAVLYVPVLQVFFHTVPLLPHDWLIIIMLGFTSVLVPYASNFLKRGAGIE